MEKVHMLWFHLHIILEKCKLTYGGKKRVNGYLRVRWRWGEWGEAEGRGTVGHKETFGSDEYVHYFDGGVISWVHSYSETYPTAA